MLLMPCYYMCEGQLTQKHIPAFEFAGVGVARVFGWLFSPGYA